MQPDSAPSLGPFQFRLRTLVVIVAIWAVFSWAARMTGPAWPGTLTFFTGVGIFAIGATNRSLLTMAAACLLSLIGAILTGMS